MPVWRCTGPEHLSHTLVRHTCSIHRSTCLIHQSSTLCSGYYSPAHSLWPGRAWATRPEAPWSTSRSWPSAVPDCCRCSAGCAWSPGLASASNCPPRWTPCPAACATWSRPECRSPWCCSAATNRDAQRPARSVEALWKAAFGSRRTRRVWCCLEVVGEVWRGLKVVAEVWKWLEGIEGGCRRFGSGCKGLQEV